ncbi:MAG: HlyC/CorC family transporter [Bacteroidales bacterium]|nr:HlyC/CorC family transporter [Bacteroidales bacterium]
MVTLLLYLFIALFFSFLCSLLEASLLSITPSFIAAKVNENKSYARTLKRFKEEVDLPLAAILTLNTFAHTIGAAGVGAQAQEIWGNEYLSLTSAALTIVILIFSEIIPKTLGASFWKKLAPFTARSLVVLIYSPLYPFIILSKFITKILNKEKGSAVLSRAEFQAMAEIGVQEGIFRKEESQILMNLMKFNNIVVKSIMTPRTVVVSASEEETVHSFLEAYEKVRVSRIPIYKENIDNITGYVLKDDLMQHMIEKKWNRKLHALGRNIMVVNEKMPIIRLFYKLIQEKEHIAMVVGEYGEMSGIVTMEDVIETLLGAEIMDELDNVEDMQKQAMKIWERRAKRLGLI